MRRRLVIGTVAFTVLALLAAGGYVGFRHVTLGAPPPDGPKFNDIGDELPTQEQFDRLAESDPVKLFAACLTRYQREARGGMRCVMEKQERLGGNPELDPLEVVDLRVRGDVPDPESNKTAIEVQILWKSGAKKPPVPLAAPIEGTLFSELPPPHGYGGKAVTWQPAARFGSAVREPMGVNSEMAQKQSRYCVRDAGIYRSMLRSHEVWKAQQREGALRYEYLGTERVAKAGNRECHKMRRVCSGTELDSFELGGAAPTAPAVIAAQGFTEVILYYDRERWLQVGTEQFRAGPSGGKVNVASYFFRDVELNPAFGPDDFSTRAFKK